MSNFFWIALIGVTGTVLFLFSPAVLNRPVTRWQRVLVALIQALPILLLLWLLLDPVFHFFKSQTFPPKVLIVVDDSPSMTLAGGDNQARLEQQRKVKPDLKAEIERHPANPEVFDASLSRLIPSGFSASDFALAFDSIQRKYPDLSAIVFMSDGNHHGTSTVEALSKRLHRPVFALGIGSEEEPEDFGVHWLEVPPKVQLGSPFYARYGIESRLGQSQVVEIKVHMNGREVFQKEINLPGGPAIREEWISLSAESEGEAIVSIHGELPTTSTPFIDEATVTVLNQPATILILEGKPSRMTQLITQVALKSGRYRVQRPVPLPEGKGGVVWNLVRPIAGKEASLPWAGEEMTRYEKGEWERRLEELPAEAQVVVLGNHAFQGLPEGYQGILADRLREGPIHAMVLPGAGRGADLSKGGGAFADLLRIQDRTILSGIPLQLSVPEEVRHHPILAPCWSYTGKPRELESDHVFSQVPDGAQVILQDQQGNPLILLQRFDLSQAVLFSLNKFWSLKSTLNSEEDRLFCEGVILGCLDYLAGPVEGASPEVRVEPMIPVVGQKTRIMVQNRALEPGKVAGGLEYKAPGSDWVALPLLGDPSFRGMAHSEILPRVAGNHQIRYGSGELMVSFEVLDRPPENDDLTQNRRVLEQMAEESGGKYLPLSDWRSLPDMMNLNAHIREIPINQPLRHHAMMGAGIILLLCLGWGIRRLYSLP